MKTIEQINAILAIRLATQRGGKGKITRETLRNLAKLGHCILPSGFGRRVSVVAAV